VNNPKFFNTRRTVNKSDAATMKNSRMKNPPRTQRQAGHAASLGELEKLAEEFFTSRASNMHNFALRVTAIKEINEYLRGHGVRQYQLIPRMRLRAKHVFLNPTSLYDTLASFRKEGLPSRKQFMETIQTEIFNIFKPSNRPQSLRPQTGFTTSSSFTFDDYKPRFTFSNLITTDGKDASVGVYRWRKSKLSHDSTGFEARANQDLEKAKQMLEEGAVLVGVDPGRKGIVTAQVENGIFLKPKSQYTYELSAGKWAHITKRNWRTSKITSWMHRAKIYNWMQNFPSHPLDRIDYLYGPGSKFDAAARFFLSLKYKQMRRDQFISNERAIKRVAKEITGLNSESGNLVVAFGNARFSQTSRGFTPGGNVAKIFDQLKVMDKVLPIYVDEYHTSQVCHACVKNNRDIFKVVGLGTKQDLYASSASYDQIDNPWHIRRCMSCSMRYNRDQNSAQNMCIRLRADLYDHLPDCFNRTKGRIPLREQLASLKDK
jgi:hypothetical protein